MARRELLQGKEIKNIIKENYNYDLSLIDDEARFRVTDTVKIICPKHGVITKQVRHLVNEKVGCPRCAKERECKYSVEEFIELAKTVHSNKYNYSLINVIEKALQNTRWQSK